MPQTTDSRLEYLFTRYFSKSSTPEEESELLELIGHAQYDEQLKYLMDQVWRRLSPAYRLNDQQSEHIFSGIVSSHPEKVATGRVNGRRIMRWSAVAASILVLFAAGWVWHKKIGGTQKIKEISGLTAQSAEVAVPGSNKAVLILGNGSSVVLDSVHNGILAKQGNMAILKLNGRLSYKEQGEKKGVIMYNTIITPRGGQYQVILPDGSKVWLNAASSLRFPTRFTGTQRSVELTGEGYFEVAKNQDMPFKVSVDGMEVNVLGTHFNIMAYRDEPAIRTTLLEGAVAVLEGGQRVLLKPGQQASIVPGAIGDIKVSMADTQAATAWKEGLFLFRNTDIRAVLREIDKWYDTKVIYKGHVSAYLNGMISRNTDLSKVLHMLEVTSDIDFIIQGQTIIVKPKN
jgi:ferric-dicitrate binding protein FerR (iron transport regulator)